MKSVIFDFDGTLTCKNSNVWKSIWQNLGFDVGKNSHYAKLYGDFISEKITHQQWCDLTCEAFISKGMNKSVLDEIADKTKLISGAHEVFETLKKEGFSLHIVSGNIISVIERVLGENVKFFDSINANVLQFDERGRLLHIQGTNYDFAGKARFVEEFKIKTGILAKNIVFVGNGGNDEWAYLSGCRTLCINPDDAEKSNSTKWHIVLNDVSDLKQILPEINNLGLKM